MALAAQTQLAQPVHYSYTIIDSLDNVHVHATTAVDPLNNESESTEQMPLGGISGRNPVAVTAKTIAIGNHAWSESTPPGGGWHETTIRPQPPFPLEQLLPYIVDVHDVVGKFVRGHSTQGLSATLDKQGVNVLEGLAKGGPVGSSQQIIMKIVFKLWIGTGAHHLRALQLTEDCVQSGRPYQVVETGTYFDWGRGLALTNPT